MSNADHVLRDVGDERMRQDDKWGIVSRSPLEWLAIIAEEFGEVAMEVTQGCVPPESGLNRPAYRKELIQLAACCVSAVEDLDYGQAGR